MNRLILLILVVAFFAIAENNPPSQKEEGGFVVEKKEGKTIKYKKKATYDFEGSSIDGMYNKPSGSYISNIKDVKARSIIKMRENFDAEVIDSQRYLK
jgi:hypothetical protein